MAHTLYEIDVRLREIEPPIWRTIELSGTSSLEEVHLAIQAAMGWTNSHLHQFIIRKTHYGADVDDSGELELEDERAYKLEAVAKVRDVFLYEYDFGDGWEHEITVKSVTKHTKAPKPRCIGGARACPPEDCGGAGGYQHLLEILRDPTNPEHDSMVEWSSNFEPERFTLPKGGLELRREITRLESFTEEDDSFDEYEAELPKHFIQSVLALGPIQRASLGALIAASLADELVEVTAIADQLALALAKKTLPVRQARKRTKL